MNAIPQTKSNTTDKTRETIETWIKVKIFEYVGVPLSKMSANDSIENFGIDSAGSVSFAFDIEDYLNLDYQLEPEVLFEHHTIGKLTDFMLSKTMGN